MAGVSPPINARGKYGLISPFSTEPGAIYTCEGIEGIEALESRDIDVFAQFYSPVGLTAADLKSDRLNNIDIITLMSSTAETIYIPSTYIATFPATASVKYAHTIVGLDLGALPVGTDVNSMLSELSATTKSFVGITPEIRIMLSDITTAVDYQEYATLEKARQAEIDYSSTLSVQLRDTQRRLETLQQENDALVEALIIAQGT